LAAFGLQRPRKTAGPSEESGNLEFVGAVMDITQRKLTEETQRVQEREREEMQCQLQQAAKLEALGRLRVASRTTSTTYSARSPGTARPRGTTSAKQPRAPSLDQMMQAGARGKELVGRILAFSRSKRDERVAVHVQVVVEDARSAHTVAARRRAAGQATLDAPSRIQGSTEASIRVHHPQWTA
jgi:hypothetical protein